MNQVDQLNKKPWSSYPPKKIQILISWVKTYRIELMLIPEFCSQVDSRCLTFREKFPVHFLEGPVVGSGSHHSRAVSCKSQIWSTFQKNPNVSGGYHGLFTVVSQNDLRLDKFQRMINCTNQLGVYPTVF